MTAKQLRKELVKIHNLLDKADAIFNELPDGMLDIILNYHNEYSSLNHCIRWGTTATDELIEDAKKLTEEYNEQY